MAVVEAQITASLARDFDFRFDCNGVEFEFRFRFNRRDDRWSLSIFDAAGNPVRQGLAGVSNFDLLFRIADIVRPAGRVFLTDTRTPPSDAVFDELGAAIPFLYVEASDG